MARVEKYKKTNNFEPVCLILETETEVKHLLSLLDRSHFFKEQVVFFDSIVDYDLFERLSACCDQNNISWGK